MTPTAPETLIDAVAQLNATASHTGFTVEDVTRALYAVLARTFGAEGAGPAPLLIRRSGPSTLQLYNTPERSWSDRDLAVAQMYVDIAASYSALVAARDDSRHRRHEAEQRFTEVDLTGLLHRDQLVDRIEHAALTASRKLTAIAVLIIDIDRHPEINDTEGRATSEHLLPEVAHRLKDTLRANDTVARWAGSQFVVVCEDLTGSPVQIDRLIHNLGRRIRRNLQDSPLDRLDETVASVSIGAAVSSQGRSPGDLVHHAQRALFSAQQRGGDQLVFNRPEPTTLARRGIRRGGGLSR
jgi:diguanylate cyclase (GGDEF)-like protein